VYRATANEVTKNKSEYRNATQNRKEKLKPEHKEQSKRRTRKGDPSTTRKKLQGTTTPKHSSLKESEFNQATTTAVTSISTVFHCFRIYFFCLSQVPQHAPWILETLIFERCGRQTSSQPRVCA
jgi:hypothetical protein